MKTFSNITAAALFTLMTVGAPLALAQQKDSSGRAKSSQQEQQLTDEEVGKAVRNKLKRIDGIDTSKLKVEADNGAATITGTVNNLIEIDRILEAASAVRGVENVITSYVVEPEKRPDNKIQQDVRDALEADVVTSDTDPKVTVNNGIVTLNGEAKTWPEKHLATWLASEIRGVREVRNEMTLAASNRTDPEIKQSIEQRFATDPLVTDSITAKVDDGRVTLSGEVPSALEKRWAIADAHVPGVRDVNASGLRVKANAGASGSEPARRMTDNELKNAIVSAFLIDPRVFSFNPKVEVTNGEVTLSGAVSNLKAKQAAVQLAENTAGVVEVKDNLTVRAEPRADDQITQDLRKAFGRSLLVDANQIKVRVENGRATLTGTVDSSFEKWGADDIAARTRGITEINNQLVVDDVPQITAATEYYYYPWHSSYIPWTYSPSNEPKTDAKLLADVKSHLSWSPFTDAEDITVSVDQGVVTLSGEVDSRMEKGAAADNAYQAGARRVENRLSVLTPTGR